MNERKLFVWMFVWPFIVIGGGSMVMWLLFSGKPALQVFGSIVAVVVAIFATYSFPYWRDGSERKVRT